MVATSNETEESMHIYGKDLGGPKGLGNQSQYSIIEIPKKYENS